MAVRTWVAAGNGLVLALDKLETQHSRDWLNELGMYVAARQWDCLTSEFEVAANRPNEAHLGLYHQFGFCLVHKSRKYSLFYILLFCVFQSQASWCTRSMTSVAFT